MRSALPIALFFVGGLLSGGVPRPLAAQTPRVGGGVDRATALLRDPAGLVGRTGLVHVPSAAAIPSGAADVTLDNARVPWLGSTLGLQRNVFVSIGFLPRLTLTARGTMARDSIDRGELRDLSVSAQLLLVEEKGNRPAIAVGVVDPDTGGEPPYFTSYYVTASETLFGRTRLTAGYGLGPRTPDGPFGGVELSLGRWATALGEYDGAHWNGGLRVFPFPGAAEGLGVQPRFDILRRGGVGQALGAGFRLRLGGGPRRPGARMEADPSSTAAGLAGRTRLPRATDRGAEAVTSELVALGFENVRAAVDPDAAGSTLVVEYENRIFNRNEWHALGVVMGVVAIRAPDGTDRMRVTIRKVDVAVLTVTSGVEAFRAFVEGTLPLPVFDGQLEVSDPVSTLPAGGTVEAPANPARFKLDVFVRPRVETSFLTELGSVGARLTLLPDAYLSLGHGFVLNGRLTVSGGHTADYPWFLEDPNGDRVLLHKAMRIGLGTRRPPLAPLTQFSVGWFRRDMVGVANEIDVSLAEGRVSLGATLAAFGPELGTIDSGVALGRVRLRYPELDATAGVEAGVFRNGDPGASAELSRFFGDTEVGFYVRSTTFGTVAGMRLSLPLTPARELRPMRLRPRLPDLYTHTQQITILEHPSVIKRYVGRLLETDHEPARVLRARDRLHGPDLRAHLETLRDAACRWLL